MKFDFVDCLAYLLFITFIILSIQPVGGMRDYPFSIGNIIIITVSVISMILYYTERKEEKEVINDKSIINPTKL